jgi:hypothetical protein
MKEETINKFAEKMLAYMNNTEAFLQKETPEYIKQLLEYEVFESYLAIFTLIALTLILGGASLAACIVKDKFFEGVYHGAKKDFVEFIAVGGFILAAVTFVCALIVIPANVSKIIKINKAPKVFIVEHIKGL